METVKQLTADTARATPRDARAGLPAEPDEHPEPNAYLAGYEHGGELDHDIADTARLAAVG